MKLRAYITALHAALFAILLAVTPAGSGSMTLMGAGKAGGCATGTFAIDGPANGVTGNQSTANLALPGLTTTFCSDVIVVALITNGTSITSVTSSPAGLTFTREPGLTPPNAGGTILDVWTAVAASALSSEVITINNSAAFTTALAFAISGAKTSAPFDVNAAIPSTTTANAAPATITTSAIASNIFAFGIGVLTTSTPGTGYTNMNATALSNFLLLNYKFASGGSPLSGDVWNAANTAGSIATAIVKGP